MLSSFPPSLHSWFLRMIADCVVKGTGKWTAINALDLGQPVTLIGEAVFARCLSAIRDERARASKVIDGGNSHFPDSNRRCKYLADKGYHLRP